MAEEPAKTYFFDDFTESEYQKLLQMAKARWEFCSYPEYRKPGRICLWRHDIDSSVHRAYRLAQIEASEGVQATYFVLLHSERYNALEPEVFSRLVKIRDLGHDLALHFDPTFYLDHIRDLNDLESYLVFEQQFLGKLFGIEIKSFSFHNPAIGGWLKYDAEQMGGMINAYGRTLQTEFGYCSDSNGYWRYRRLREVLESGEDEKLQVLTHPVFWVPTPMSPRDRILRAIEGRAASGIQRYDALLEKIGRKNIR